MTSKSIIFLVLLIFGQSFGLSMSKEENLPADEFARRRAIFIAELRNLNACAILHSAPVYDRNLAVEFPYRQDSDFLYLTGWVQNQSILVITPKMDSANQAEVSFFVPSRDPKREIWTGPKKGLAEARILPGVDQGIEYAEFYEHLGNLINGYDRLVISYGNDAEFRLDFDRQLKSMYLRPTIVQEAASILTSQRLIKSDREIQSLEQAIKITGQAIIESWPLIPTLKFEYEVQAEIEYGFTKRGATRFAFPSIVAAGKNTTFLHYEDNRGELVSGALILTDVGAEWDYYAADITHTVPVSGKFSPEQSLIYQLVLKAQLAAIATIKPGSSFHATHDVAVDVITAGLVDLGLLKGGLAELISQKEYRKYFMHGTTHWLGLDVHDVGGRVDSNGQPHMLKAGMVLTVEPGIYIGASEDVEPRWWNIGVRIEDDVLVTKKGYRVLSESIPKTIAEIEDLMQP